MEGLLDHMLRDTLTRVGGVDRCVSEFIRITDRLLPRRVFTRIVPELLTGGRTHAGVPVRAQLLGSDPQCLAENAARLAELHPEGIDLNFGCPAKTVNRHRGGAVLLDEPELVGEIVAAVRRAVPARLPVSAKMRLGNEDRGRMLDCARAIEAGGASELVVHGRTKRDGYKPPAYWDQIAAVREAVAMTVVANGEVWTVEDARRCLSESGCTSLMLGRGMVADPGLALAVRADLMGQGAAPLPWDDVVPLMAGFFAQVRRNVATRHQAGRLKQWLHYLRRRYPEAEETYQRVRTINAPDELALTLFGRALDPKTPPADEAEGLGVDADTEVDVENDLDADAVRAPDTDQQQDRDTLIAA
ncbi:tRNA dihydrouridine(16) synthase DusC [Roseateles aquatilis]|uniref:tRNA-dihydrouridine(16) synthase n=1 Tax=Roseateles aquatilis TaxID=431061 RepID=A0A246JGD0_9BURK|nr:tRNA-dihydrouridine synthase [Roseateles aquatilis]OWQ91610.1 tRNA dihydrouridine(16) synthase DusC [Roseateles aquatilis]